MNGTDRQWAQQTFEKLQTKLGAECARVGDKIPYYIRDGRYLDVTEDGKLSLNWWTNGFWGGILWQMYNATGDESYRAAAEGVEKRLDGPLNEYVNLHHDVGFMWMHTAVADWRLTKSEASKVRGLRAAGVLAGRYNPAGRFIRAWNMDRTGWIIVDCMMNLPLLYWASDETGDPRFKYIAMSHADTCMNVTVRPDGSCNHISILDPDTGALVENPGGQGYASGSSWSRGQSWAIYGFALSYRHTGKQEYLETAKKAAHYFIANASLHDWLPLVDFRAPAEPVMIDSTAGACAACGLLEIAGHVGELERPLYEDAAVRILKALDAACCNWNPEEDAVVGKGCSAYHAQLPDREMPIIYGDYFYTEAVLRLLGKDFLIW